MEEDPSVATKTCLPQVTLRSREDKSWKQQVNWWAKLNITARLQMLVWIVLKELTVDSCTCIGICYIY